MEQQVVKPQVQVQQQVEVMEGLEEQTEQVELTEALMAAEEEGEEIVAEELKEAV